MEKHKFRIRMGDVSTCHGDGHVNLTIEDVLSGNTIIDIEMPYDVFGKFVKSAGSVVVDAEVRGLEHIGKKYVVERRSIVCNENFEHLTYELKRAAQELWIRVNCQEPGWGVHSYLGSRDSVVRKDGVTTFNYTVFKYVELSPEERQNFFQQRFY